MERILYNSKLKKILISLLAAILILQFMMPSVVLAATYEHEYLSYKEWIQMYPDYEETIKETIVDFFCHKIDKFQYIDDASIRKTTVENILLEKPEKVIISKGTLKDGWFSNSFTLTSADIADYDNEGNPTGEILPATKVYSDFLEWIKDTGKTQEDLDEELKPYIEKLCVNEGQELDYRIDKEEMLEGILEDYRDIIEITFIGKPESYEIQSVDIPGKDKTEICAPYVPEDDEDRDSDLGGILLKPVFFLVNFIADAIMGMLDGIMEDGSLSIVPNLMTSNPKDFEGKPNYTESMSVFVTGANYPKIRYSPERIFSGKVPILSIDFISADGADGPLGDVRNVIASWYKALRLFAIIGLLSVLIYTGIKIMLSSNAKDKAKYKEWILNWFLAVAILFSMHYIMSFIISITDEINNLLSTTADGIKAEITVNGTVHRFKTNLIGMVRFMIQSDDFMTKVGYEVMYIALIVYTFKFTFTYLKRVLNMAFLTLIAPIVALMYPIDKMTDGSAQGFDMWLKEYIFNALLQPMHGLMYYILVTSAISVAASNPIYGIVVLMFMTEAERLLKKLFGFDKAHGGTVGGMANAFAAGAVASQIGKLARGAIGGNSKGGGNSGKSDSNGGELPPTIKDTDVESNFNGDANLNEEPNNDSNQYEDTRNDDDTGNNNGYSRGGASVGDAYQNSADPVADAEREALEEKIADGQISEEDLTDEQRELLGIGGNDQTEEPIEKDESNDTQQPQSQSSDASDSQQTESTDNQLEETKRSRFAQGAKAVGKRLARPVWDFDKSKKYNGKRLARKLARGAVGFSVGTAAAAVQAGISITDGKYSPLEGIASFGAGFAGGGRIADGIVNGATGLIDTYQKGAHSVDNPKQKKEWEEKQRARYFEDWSNRDDVNKVFKDKFGEDKFKEMKEQAYHYTDRGYTDPKEVAKLMKASGKLDWDHKKTIATMNFKKTLQDQQAYGAASDKTKEKKYIDSIIQNNGLSGDEAKKVRAQYEEAFKSLAALNKAMK